MDNSPRLIYLFDQEIGLNPDLSGCNSCLFVEYIYFTGVVCHVGEVKLDASGRCQCYCSEKRLTD